MTDPNARVGPLSPQDVERRNQEQLVQAALRMGTVPKFYANSFGIAQTSTDVSLVVLMNGQPVGTVSLSYITAKSLVADLGAVIDKFEKATGQKIKTIGEVTDDLRREFGDSNVSF
jgi:hypothetical protein